MAQEGYIDYDDLNAPMFADLNNIGDVTGSFFQGDTPARGRVNGHDQSAVELDIEGEEQVQQSALESVPAEESEVAGSKAAAVPPVPLVAVENTRQEELDPIRLPAVGTVDPHGGSRTQSANDIPDPENLGALAMFGNTDRTKVKRRSELRREQRLAEGANASGAESTPTSNARVRGRSPSVEIVGVRSGSAARRDANSAPAPRPASITRNRAQGERSLSRGPTARTAPVSGPVTRSRSRQNVGSAAPAGGDAPLAANRNDRAGSVSRSRNASVERVTAAVAGIRLTERASRDPVRRPASGAARGPVAVRAVENGTGATMRQPPVLANRRGPAPRAPVTVGASSAVRPAVGSSAIRRPSATRAPITVGASTAARTATATGAPAARAPSASRAPTASSSVRTAAASAAIRRSNVAGGSTARPASSTSASSVHQAPSSAARTSASGRMATASGSALRPPTVRQPSVTRPPVASASRHAPANNTAGVVPNRVAAARTSAVRHPRGPVSIAPVSAPRPAVAPARMAFGSAVRQSGASAAGPSRAAVANAGTPRSRVDVASLVSRLSQPKNAGPRRSAMPAVVGTPSRMVPQGGLNGLPSARRSHSTSRAVSRNGSNADLPAAAPADAPATLAIVDAPANVPNNEEEPAAHDAPQEPQQ